MDVDARFGGRVRKGTTVVELQGEGAESCREAPRQRTVSVGESAWQFFGVEAFELQKLVVHVPSMMEAGFQVKSPCLRGLGFDMLGPEPPGAGLLDLGFLLSFLMPLIPIENLEDPRVDLYRSIKDAHLRAREGLFVVEGRENLRCMIETSAYTPLSALVSPTAHDALEDVWSKLDPEVPVYRVPGELLRSLAGFDLHRGCLALGERPPEEGVRPLIEGLPEAPLPSCVVVLENLGNHDNVGGIFRTARALGADAVLMCARSCDPLYRKAIRVSMGASLCVPWGRDEDWPDCVAALREAGYVTVALDPRGEPMGPSGSLPPRVALFLGSEGDGLSSELLGEVDLRRTIPMAQGVDSLNVTVAAGIGMHVWRDGAGLEEAGS